MPFFLRAAGHFFASGEKKRRIAFDLGRGPLDRRGFKTRHIQMTDMQGAPAGSPPASPPTTSEIQAAQLLQGAQLPPMHNFECDFFCPNALAYVSSLLLSYFAKALVASSTDVQASSVNTALREFTTDVKQVKMGDGNADFGEVLSEVMEKHVRKKKTMWKSVFSRAESEKEKVDSTKQEIEEAGFFDETMRSGLAAVLITMLDPNHQAHCGQTAETSEAHESHRAVCDFRPLSCENVDCLAVFASKNLDFHDQRCPHKCLPCPQECTLEVKRSEMDAHVIGPCAKKVVTCPLAKIGCDLHLHQGDVETHCDSQAHRHLVLAVGIIQQQSQQIKQMKEEMVELRASQERMEQTVKGLQLGTVASLSAEATSVRDELKKLKAESKKTRLQMEILVKPK
jgi:hypothetical protein